MKNGILSLLIILIVVSCVQKQNKNEDILENQNSNIQELIPDSIRAKQIADLKYGMFICWSFSTFYGQEWTPTLDKDAKYFKAKGCDTDQWCKTAKDAGMSYILFLSKHHDGFCL